MISRYLVIALAVGATVMRLTQHAWVEATGLAALAGGLVILQLATRKPAIKPLAWVAFSVTGITMIVVWVRMRP